MRCMASDILLPPHGDVWSSSLHLKAFFTCSGAMEDRQSTLDTMRLILCKPLSTKDASTKDAMLRFSYNLNPSGATAHYVKKYILTDNLSPTHENIEKQWRWSNTCFSARAWVHNLCLPSAQAVSVTQKHGREQWWWVTLSVTFTPGQRAAKLQ